MPIALPVAEKGLITPLTPKPNHPYRTFNSDLHLQSIPPTTRPPAKTVHFAHVRPQPMTLM